MHAACLGDCPEFGALCTGHHPLAHAPAASTVSSSPAFVKKPQIPTKVPDQTGLSQQLPAGTVKGEVTVLLCLSTCAPSISV